MADTNLASRSSSITGMAETGETPSLTRNRRLRAGAAPLLSAAFLAMILVTWDLLTRFGIVSGFILAPPADVVTALADSVTSGQLWPHLWATASETVLGFGISLVAAVVIGSVFALSPVLRRAIYPYIVASQTFPKVAVAPLVVAAFGYGLAPKAVLAVLLAFFPILVNTIAGLTEISDDEIDLFRSMRASRWQELRYLRIPNALAFIFPALNSAVVLALIGAIVGEFVAARVGIGYAIKLYATTGDTAATYAMLIVLAVFGLLMYGALTVLERVFRRNW